ncbi:MAG: polysaccharide biosynthesis protein, partial [Acidimicrobiia bacterium]
LRWRGEARSVLGDIRDATTLLRTFETIRPHVVFHAAALKHVPVLEEYPEEAVLANVVGTRNVIEAGSRTGMGNFVLISTDKAVDPTSVMGASKRVAELMVRVAGERRDDCTYTAVRFGNVLGSRGSVIPTFVSQIQAGGPVTVTDPQMTRYFMTVDEAVQLVLQAGAIAEGSEVFLLDMGEPVRIEALARRLIRLSGLTPDKDIEILYTGRRPGEKMNEILSSGPMEMTQNPKIFEVKLDHPAAAVVASTVSDLEDAARQGQTEKVIDLLTLIAGGHLNGGTVIDETGTRLTSSWS